MPNPREPSEQPPMPPPGWTPEPPINEPEPDRLPDEAPLPNPDENPNPPAYSRRAIERSIEKSWRV
nr:hypothetical protein [Rhizobium populisoli]